MKTYWKDGLAICRMGDPKGLSTIVRLSRGDEMLREMNMLADRIEQLEAVVEKLPKTADGVPVVPQQDRVYWKEGDVVASTGIVREPSGSYTAGGERLVEHCYSTHEAALAAKEARDATTH